MRLLSVMVAALALVLASPALATSTASGSRQSPDKSYTISAVGGTQTSVSWLVKPAKGTVYVEHRCYHVSGTNDFTLLSQEFSDPMTLSGRNSTFGPFAVPAGANECTGLVYDAATNTPVSNVGAYFP